jgi:hypothetical protein
MVNQWSDSPTVIGRPVIQDVMQILAGDPFHGLQRSEDERYHVRGILLFGGKF